MPLECAGHVALVGKTAARGDTFERNVLAGELALGVFEPPLDDIGMGRTAELGAKLASEMEDAEPRQLCEFSQ